MKKIAFAGTDGRTLLSALVTATATNEAGVNEFEGIVIRGNDAMARYAAVMDWPVKFFPTASNSVADYAKAIVDAFMAGKIDYVVPMPEALLFDGLVDAVADAGYGGHIVGLNRLGAFIEADKIACKHLCRDAGIPVADSWVDADARDYQRVLDSCLLFIQHHGGAVLKYPYSAGGKGARVILNSWEIRDVYDTLIKDYQDSYKKLHGKGRWPLLIESLMSGVEISFTLLVDGLGAYRILPTAMDYPERYVGPASRNNPITGGMGAVSPHPMETPALIEMAGETIAKPLIARMKKMGILRPCVLYPGCFISLDGQMQPTRIRVSEINIRPGEPEMQPVVRRLRNLGALIAATCEGRLKEVAPEIRTEQIAANVALVTGPGGPDGQKGYPGSCTRGEPVEIDRKYLKRKGIQLIPSAMAMNEEDDFISDGTRVAYLNCNVTVKDTDDRSVMADRLQTKLLAAFDNGKVRVAPRENPEGNRLDLRRDIGSHYRIQAKTFPEN